MLFGHSGPSRSIRNVEQKDGMVYLYSDHGTHRIYAINNILRVTYTVQPEFSAKEKPGVIQNAPTGEMSVVETEDTITIEFAGATLAVDRKTSAYTYLDGDGEVLFKEHGRHPRCFEKFPTYKLSGGHQVTEKVETVDGVKELIREAEKEFTGDSYHISWYMDWEDEAIYGLGQHEEGYGSLRGKTVYVHQANRKSAVPMLVTTKKCGILVDTYAPIIFNDNAPVSYLYCEAAPELDYYFIKGDSMNDVIAGYRYLTGKATMLPKWAFGYVQSKERYNDAEEIIGIAEEAARRNIGLDCVVLDWISWPDNQWGQKSFDHSRFPDPKGMTDRLHDMGCHFMLSIWPSTSDNCPNRKEFDETDTMLKGSGVYNALSAKGREIYWKQLMEEHFPAGVDAWWCDSSEPITPEWSLRERPDASTLYHMFHREMGLRIGEEYSNSFCLYHAQGIYEGQRAAMADALKNDSSYKEKRVCNLTRSGYTGQQRYGTIMWSGDIDASWDTYRRQIGAGLNFCASGLPYWTLDIGAFFIREGDFWYWQGEYDDGPKDKGFCELYTRWFQYGAFLPIFRTHGTDYSREIWAFGDEGDMFYDAMVAANRLRYRLMPYIYSEAGKVWLKDGSLMTPLAFAFPDDTLVHNITDQYMFGSIMVCPVTEPMYFEHGSKPITGVERTRRVYLPAGSIWFDFYSKKQYDGGQWITVDAPIDRIPLFVRDGSIIPMTEPALNTAAQTAPITFEVYSTHPCSYEFYEDAGDGYGYEKGEYTITKIER